MYDNTVRAGLSFGLVRGLTKNHEEENPVEQLGKGKAGETNPGIKHLSSPQPRDIPSGGNQLSRSYHETHKPQSTQTQ
jgi:hypothetical protein